MTLAEYIEAMIMPTVVFVGIGGLIQVLLHQITNKKLESHKADLTRANTAELERLKTELGKESREHEIRFKKMHETVSEVLDKVFRHLSATMFSLQRLLTGALDDTDAIRILKFTEQQKNYNQLADAMNEGLLYIPDEVFAQIKQLLFKISSIMEEYRQNPPEYKGGWEALIFRQYTEEMMKVDVLFQTVRTTMQNLLGFKSTSEPAMMIVGV